MSCILVETPVALDIILCHTRALVLKYETKCLTVSLKAVSRV